MIEKLNQAIFAIPPDANHRAGGQEFEFTLKIRVESLTDLWRAAVANHMRNGAASEEEIDELFGPIEDPSVEDCVMALTLPRTITGCSMQTVSLNACA